MITVMTCKFKNFLALVISVSITSLIFLCFFVRDQPVDIKSFVSETHKQFKTLQENFPYPRLSERKMEIEEKYLDLLGFNKQTHDPTVSHQPTKTTNESNLNKMNLPVVLVSAISKNEIDEEEDFIRTVESAFPTNSIVLWDLESTTAPKGGETDFSMELKQFCNSSKCTVERFPFDDYPDHVRDQSMHAYRPLIIQMMLDRGGCILWLDIKRRLVPFAKEKLGEFLTLAMKGGSDGIVGWSSEGHLGLDIHMTHPTSALTHPKMFSLFDTDVENYYFHRMIDPAQLLVCNTQTVHSKIMFPWIKCTLTKECISPFGAQSSGCRFDKKPLYRYSGCHAYDSSALNVALGIAFPLHQPYIARSPISQLSDPIAVNQTTVST